MKKDRVIYTCCVGNYDSIIQPDVVSDSFDYVCFADNCREQQIGIWKIRKIPFSDSNNSRVSRYPKLLPHKVLPKYLYSVYIDANIRILNNQFYEAIEKKISNGCLVAQVPHCVPLVDCVYDEMAYAFKWNKVSLYEVLRHAHHLRASRFPEHAGLFENNLIFRCHMNKNVIEMSEMWWDEYIKYAPRDQFSLMYVYWKSHFTPDYFFDDKTCTRNCTFLKYYDHLSTKKRHVSLKEKLTWRLHWYLAPLVRCML